MIASVLLQINRIILGGIKADDKLVSVVFLTYGHFKMQCQIMVLQQLPLCESGTGCSFGTDNICMQQNIIYQG